MMFAIGAMALLAGVGFAIDYTGMTSHSAYLQNLADSGALAAAGSGNDKQGQLKQVAQEHIDENNDKAFTVKTDLKLEDDFIIVKTSTKYENQFMGIFGKKEIDVTAVAKAPLPKNNPINIALVLDRTGSMDGQKMTDLKAAATGLIDVLDSYKVDLKTAVIPFSKYVNVGMANRNVSWMDVPDDSTTTGAEVCKMKKDLVNPGLCTTTTTPSTCSNDGVSYACNKTNRSCPDSAYGPEYEHCSIPTSTSEWRGCAGSRPGGHHKKPEYNNKKIPGIMNAWCGEEMLPLTTNKIEVRNKISSLSSSGNTYIPSGLIWGWRALNDKEPLADLTNKPNERKRVLLSLIHI